MSNYATALFSLALIGSSHAGLLRRTATTCKDYEGWQSEQYGDACDFYAQFDYCNEYGPTEPNEAGIYAQEACCECGGGINIDDSPLSTLTDIDDSTSSSVCTITTPTTSGNPIEVPANLVPNNVDPDTTDAVCQYIDLSCVSPSSNPGYADEAYGDRVFTSDDMWETSFYIMLFVNCERQARGLMPLELYSQDKMLGMHATYRLKEGHEGYEERSEIATGAPSEAAGGGPLIGAENVDGDEDDNGNSIWDPQEAGRRATSGHNGSANNGLVDHGDSMTDPTFSCVYATVTMDTNEGEEHRMLDVILYGTEC